jgi:cell division protein FtsI (penicillin-binding protein 3)
VLAVLLVLSLFGGRLVQLQGADASQYAEAALKQRTSKTTLWADRGQVLDDHGVVLATSVERRTVVGDPKTIADYNLRTNPETGEKTARKPQLGTGPAGVAEVLAPLLGADEAALTATLTGTNRYVVVAKGITPEVWQRINDADLPGISSERTTQRVYPTGNAASTLVGILGRDGSGLSGLEIADNSTLQGTNGWMRYERSLGGQQIPLGDSTVKEPVDGDSLHLTIDQDLQWKAESAIAAQVAATGAKNGTVVIMDKQQRLLAMASAPSFDPATNKFTNEQLNNTALTESFEPGSTAKVLTMAAVIEEGLATPATQVTVPGELKRSTKVFHDSHAHGTEKLTLAGVLAQSSNIGTILAGEQLDPTTLYDYQRKFGFGVKTDLDFPGETAGKVWGPGQEGWSGTTRYTVMFGQGLSVNAVQAASVFATVADDGVRVEPTLVAGTSDPSGTYTASPAPASTRVVSPTTAATLRDMMQAVVGEDGTGEAANIPGYLVAGKTGTANRYDPTCGCYSGYTASFIGMAPADDPQLVVAVILQDPKSNYYGGAAAGPVFKDVMSYALQQRGVAPSTAAPANLPLTWGAPE